MRRVLILPKRLFSRDFFSDATYLLASNSFIQSIPVLSSLITARLYDPEEFGRFFSWLAAVSILSVIATGRLEHALGLEERGVARDNLLGTVAVLSALFCVCIGIFGAAFSKIYPKWLAVSSSIILSASIATWFQSMYQSMQSYYAVSGNLKILVRLRLVAVVSAATLQIIGGIIWASDQALIWSYQVGLVLAVLYGFLYARIKLVSSNDIMIYAKRYKKFLYFSLPADTLNTGSAQLPVTLCAKFFGAEAAGYLGLAQRTLAAPLALVSRAVLDLYRRDAGASVRATGQCREPYRRLFVLLCPIALVIGVAIWVAGPYAFGMVFGARWVPAGEVAVLLAPMIAAGFVASPLSYTFYVAERQELDLLWQVALFPVALLPFALAGSFEGAITAFGIGYATMYTVYLVMSYRAAAGRRT